MTTEDEMDDPNDNGRKPEELMRLHRTWWKQTIPQLLAEVPESFDCRAERNRAMLAVQAEGGLRVSALATNHIGDLRRSDGEIALTVQEKNGERIVPLKCSVPYVEAWLNHHPNPENPVAPLWVRGTTTEPLAQQSILRSFRTIGYDNKLKEPLTPYRLRHAFVEWLQDPADGAEDCSSGEKE